MGRDSERLDALRTECGCRAGGVATLVAVSGYGLWTLFEPGARGWTSRVGTVVAVSLAAAVAGKIFGIAWARTRYRLLTRGGPRG